MGDSIIYKLKSGKPNKFLNFLSGFAGLAIPDEVSFARYGRGYANKEDWRRDNVSRLQTRGLLHQNGPTIPRLRHKQAHS